AQGVVREFTDHELPLDAKGNEIHTLSAAFHRMVEEIKTHISEREKAERALRRSEEQLRQSLKMEAVGRLAGGVAHDFNNLLTIINGYSDALLRRLGNTDPVRREIGEIQRAGERAATLTRQLLAFSRRQVLKPQAIRLNDAVISLGSMLRPIIGEDIEISTSLCGELWTVRADPNQVEQVVLNLVVNARDAMPSGGLLSISTANVSLDAPDDGDGGTIPPGRYVRLEITDTGCGMDDETVAHIFEPFFSTKEQGKGTGLGLAMVHGIVMQSGGRIRVRSAPGRGTTFAIYFPMVDEDVPGPDEAPVVAALAADTPRGTENVLVVEDEEMVREMVQEALLSDGYSIVSAGSGAEAIRIVERHEGPIDLLLTDLVMPGMNGMELSRRLLPLRPEMKVLYMSGYSKEAIPRFGGMGEGSVFLQKPVTPSILSRKVREILDAPANPR
ncbi:MAG: response regulator, partial [Deltaproteobacteria bacterium]|nr:response regulator [Deltaproteobacteria bacterium]